MPSSFLRVSEEKSDAIIIVLVVVVIPPLFMAGCCGRVERGARTERAGPDAPQRVRRALIKHALPR